MSWQNPLWLSPHILSKFIKWDVNQKLERPYDLAWMEIKDV